MHARCAAHQLERMIELLQDGEFESIVAEEPKAVELTENIATKAPGLSGKIYGNLSSAYLQLRRYDQAVAKSERHLEIWRQANHLPEQHAVLQSQIAGYRGCKHDRPRIRPRTRLEMNPLNFSSPVPPEGPASTCTR